MSFMIRNNGLEKYQSLGFGLVLLYLGILFFMTVVLLLMEIKV